MVQDEVKDNFSAEEISVQTDILMPIPPLFRNASNPSHTISVRTPPQTLLVVAW